SAGVTGNGLSIDVNGFTIRGIAISGFGNTHVNGSTASGHGDLEILRSNTQITINTSITNCFFSCDPLGNYPALAHRRTKGTSVLIAGNSTVGVISDNYIAHSGTYGVYFNGNVDNNNVSPSPITLGNTGWVVSNNQFYDIGTNTSISAATKINDAINLMKCVRFLVTNNYISDAQQIGIDLGYNADSNFVSQNTITGAIKIDAQPPQAGIRVGLSSESDTLFRNLVFNNNSSIFKAGVWLDRSELTNTGVVTKPNINNLILENSLHDNSGSGVVLSTNLTSPSGSCYNNVISRNSTYNNTGLGIDLNYNGTSGPTTVSVSDNGDVDAGTNNIQNFPIIDSARKLSTNVYGVYGKAPAGATVEFFINDGQENKHGLLMLNYGEGKTYLGSGIEGSGSDLASGTGSYNIDGNVAVANNNLFFFMLTYNGTVGSLDSLTATATLANNTSEFGPVVNIMMTLPCTVMNFSCSYLKQDVTLNWKAICDRQFAYFEVEHSVDGKLFRVVKRIFPYAVNELKSYSFLHQSTATGQQYYRLRMVTVEGKSTYSTILSVKLKEDVLQGVTYNSSVYDNLQIGVTVANNKKIVIHLFDTGGKLVRYAEIQAIAGTNVVRMDNVTKLPAGTYLLHIITGEETFTRKIIKH
ncbi:MAG TPA: T9SS type A sorting domain-containing protein, partial [Flavitalea sp.]|nr:T9SS type A sorting domain-containing protein [Flavitalea sp.]